MGRDFRGNGILVLENELSTTWLRLYEPICFYVKRAQYLGEIVGITRAKFAFICKVGFVCGYSAKSI